MLVGCKECGQADLGGRDVSPNSFCGSDWTHSLQPTSIVEQHPHRNYFSICLDLMPLNLKMETTCSSELLVHAAALCSIKTQNAMV